MKYKIFLFAIAYLLIGFTVYSQQLSLAGKWQFAIDPDDKGMEEKWFNKKLADEISLPGSMTTNNKGDKVTLHTQWIGSIYDSSFFFRPSLAKYRTADNVKIPFWLTPDKYYVGAAWYQKEIIIPASWNKKAISLFLERTHIQSQVWVNGKKVSRQNSLVAPHQYDLTALLQPGKHIITVMIDNRIKDVNVGPDSHSVSDHTQGAWNGMIGQLAVLTSPLVSITNVQVYPDIRTKRALVKIQLINNSTATATGKIDIKAKSFNSKISHVVNTNAVAYSVRAGDSVWMEGSLTMGDKMLLWDEFDPALYLLTATLHYNNNIQQKQVQFGMREIKTAGQKILLNGRAIHLRGDLNNCEFPLTGYPPMDVQSWQRIFTIAKAHGLNHFRFHSWCPPEAAFAAADLTGFYLQPEGPSWPNHGTSLGDGRFIDQYIYEETNRMEKEYGNHPSYCFLAAGNEPAGKNQAAYLGKFVQYWQVKDPRRLYTGASVAMSWPLYPESDFMIKSGPRGLNWNAVQPETVTDYHGAIEKFTMPYVTHEMGQWCVFPDFTEIKKYTGVMKARNFEMFQQDLKDHGMLDQSHDFFMASGKLQALCYKEEIEKSLRTKNSAGFQLLGLQDFPGQGSAIIGVLSALWTAKEYINAKEWSHFCNSTVPLTRIEKFTYSNDEIFAAAVEIYHYGKADLKNAIVSWLIKNDKGVIVQKGNFDPLTIATGGNTDIGIIKFPLNAFTTAAQLKLEVTINNSSIANDWNFWVYPKTLVFDNAGIYYTDTIDAKTEQVLNNGGTVFMNAAGKVVKGKEVVQYFTPVFWNTSWFKMRPPHTLGIVVDEKHPAFNFFPTSFYTDKQWWGIVNRAQVMHLEDFPVGFCPLIQPIDTWFMNRKLGLVIEAKAGNGKIIISSAPLSDTANNIAARQLFYSLQRYVHSEKFAPQYNVDIKVLKDIFSVPSKEVWDSFTKATPDELKPVQKANN